MTLSISASKWLDSIQSEYLEGFVKDGGAAIKFAVLPDADMKTTLSAEIEKRADDLGYVVAQVDSGITRVHMIDQLFFAVAEQIPWRQTVQRVVVQLAKEKNYAKPPLPGEEPLFRRLAEANGVDPDQLLMDLRNKITNHVFGNKRLLKDFRLAMTHLALAELGGSQEAETTYQMLTDWLCGRNRAVSAVKPYQIFTRISRTNARYMLESLLPWLTFAGHTGLLILLDITRVALERNPRDERIYYTKAGVLDAYELLREFIDATDRLENWLMIVLPAQEFLDEEVGRGIGAYQALKFRVYDEIRDRSLVNPMAALVRLAPTDGSVD